MKQFLLFVALIVFTITSNAQALLNEIYPRPNENKEYNEYVELYNPSSVAEDLTCYTLVTYYYNSPTDQGFYVMRFPAGATIAPNSFYVASSAADFNYQSDGSGTATTNLNWNDAAGYITKYQFNGLGNAYTEVSGPFNDIFLKSDGASGVYAVMLFKDGTLVDYFLGSSLTNALPDYIKNKTSAAYPFEPANINAGCSLSIDFNALVIPVDNEERFNHVIPEAGTDNGYSRTCEGWIKTASIKDNTPGTFNPGQSLSGTPEITIEDVSCGAGTFTAIIGGAPAAFPAKFTLYQDQDPYGVLDAGDQPKLASGTISAPGDMINVSVPTEEFAYILVIDVNGTCSKDTMYFGQCSGAIVTPVTLSFFNVVRNSSTVQLSWETATESGNKGFSVQRRTGNSNWETITFVGSRASGGNSTVNLSYTFVDAHPAQSAILYRLVQQDQDGRLTYSEVRSVRGLDQAGKVMVFPNPSSDGSVNIIFEDASALRNVIVTDMVGRMVKQWKGVRSGSLQISKLTPGLYYISIFHSGTGRQTVEKVIVGQR